MAGRIRWLAAGAAGLLGIAGAAAGLELGDILMDSHSSESKMPPVVFPHWKHRAEFRCYACHPVIFEMEAGTNEISMDSLRDARFCGECHDGRTAFAIGFETCRVCHSAAVP